MGAYNTAVSLNVLRLKDVPKEKLPEYLKVVKMVMSIYQLNSLIADIRNINRDQLLLENSIFSESNVYNPLNSIIDSYAV